MPDNDDSFIEAGIRFTFDPEGFLRGSAEAQDALESTLAEMINFRREAQKQEQQLKDAIPGIASALGASVDEVKDALKDLKKTEQDTAKETARVQKEEARSALAEKNGQHVRKSSLPASSSVKKWRACVSASRPFGKYVIPRWRQWVLPA